jgi:hypothetical protein
MTKALPVAVGQKTQQRRSWQSTKELYYTVRELAVGQKIQQRRSWQSIKELYYTAHEVGCWSEDATAAIMVEY